jgi:hypothetical protein
MKKLLFLLLLPISSFAAQTGSLGLGGIVGEPTGGSAKYWISETSAIDAAIGLQFEHRNDHFCDNSDRRFDRCDDHYSRANLHADYLWHFDPFQVNEGRLPLYVGLGARLLTPYAEFGLRFPIGIEYLLKPIPLGIFAEVAPIFTIAPYTGGDVDGGVGVRYYFGAPTARR